MFLNVFSHSTQPVKNKITTEFRKYKEQSSGISLILTDGHTLYSPMIIATVSLLLMIARIIDHKQNYN